MRFDNPQKVKGLDRRRHRAGRRVPADPPQRRPRAVPGDRRAARREGRGRPRLRRPPHHRLRDLARPHLAPRLGCRAARHRAAPRPDRARGGAVRGIRPHRHLLGDGHHPAPQRRRDDQGDHQRRAAAGQHRQARRGAVPGARALQRAGRPHDGHLGEAARPLRRAAAPGVRLRPAARARPRRRQHRARDEGGPAEGAVRAGRQLRRGHPRQRGDPRGDALARPQRAGVDQAQPHPRAARAADAGAALPGPHREGRAAGRAGRA